MRALALKQFERIVVIITIATRLDTVNTMSRSLSVLVSQVDDRISIGTGRRQRIFMLAMHTSCFRDHKN
jgi:hypothetical protein